VPRGRFGIGGCPGLVLLAEQLLEGSAGLDAGQAQVFGYVRGRPVDRLLVGGGRP